MSAQDDFKDSSVTGAERPSQPDVTQDDYVSRTGQKDGPIPVQSDNDAVDAGGYADAGKADSDAQLRTSM